MGLYRIEVIPGTGGIRRLGWRLIRRVMCGGRSWGSGGILGGTEPCQRRFRVFIFTYLDMFNAIALRGMCITKFRPNYTKIIRVARF